MNKILRRTMPALIFLAIALLLVSSVLAIGIAPSKREFDFASSQKISYDIEIVNNAHEDLDVILYPKGEFSDSVSIRPQMIKLAANETSKKVNVELTLPESLELSGAHIVEIVAVGTENKKKNNKAMITADLAVISQLIVKVPYPEKYAEARLHVLDTAQGKPVAVSIPVFNKGTEQIESAYAIVSIYSRDGIKYDEITTEHRAIKPGDNFKFNVLSNFDYSAGSYVASARVYYDEKQINLNATFNVGDLLVDIANIVVNNFVLGDVAKFDILLHNNWNSELKNIYSEMQISGPDNKIYTDFKTVAVDIPAGGIGRLEGYWYTQGILPGVYSARIIVHYANKLSQKEYALDVYPNKIVAREQIIGQAVSPSEELDLQNNSYLFLIIGILGIIVVLLLVKLGKRTKTITTINSLSPISVSDASNKMPVATNTPAVLERVTVEQKNNIPASDSINNTQTINNETKK